MDGVDEHCARVTKMEVHSHVLRECPEACNERTKCISSIGDKSGFLPCLSGADADKICFAPHGWNLYGYGPSSRNPEIRPAVVAEI